MAVDLGVPGVGPGVRVGAGGFGTVFRAEQLGFGRPMAVKILNAVVVPVDDGHADNRHADSGVGPTSTPSTSPTGSAPPGDRAVYLNAAGEPVPAEELRILGGAPSEVVPFWTVVVTSAFQDANDAFIQVNRAAADGTNMGLRTGMIDTRTYPSLNPRPVFAAISGGLDSREGADAHRNEVRALGFAGAYRVCVGSLDQCPTNHRGT